MSLTTCPTATAILAQLGEVTAHFQPIVDLTTGRPVAYEALARFPGTSGPDVWFAAAAEAGVAAELEALAVHKALDAVPALPANTFLTVNVSPHLLGSAPLQVGAAGEGLLQRVVVELTEHTPVEDLAALHRVHLDLVVGGPRVAGVRAAAHDDVGRVVEHQRVVHLVGAGLLLQDQLRVRP